MINDYTVGFNILILKTNTIYIYSLSCYSNKSVNRERLSLLRVSVPVFFLFFYLIILNGNVIF